MAMKKVIILLLTCINWYYVFSTQITVNQDGSGDFTVIQDAINIAIDGDTVLVYPGIYFENVDLAGKNITLAGLGLVTGDDSYKYNTIIDGNNSGSAIQISNGETNALVYGLTLQHGTGTFDAFIGITSGGGIFLKDVTAKISNCIVKKNKTPVGKGGGIIIWNSNIMIEDCIIKENFSQKSGGGILCEWFSTLNISGSTITQNNSHTYGGGIAIGLESEINWDTIYLNNLFLNYASKGNDLIFAHQDAPYYLPLDTFTVAVPTPYFISSPDIEGFEMEDAVLNAQHAAITPYYGDLYVNPIIGNDTNVGNTAENPLKTLAFAVTKIGLDSIKKRNIYLANGIYSNSSNNEKFPINIRPRLNFIGQSMQGVIFDGETTTSLIRGTNEVSDYSFQKITFKRGQYINYELGVLNKNPFGVLYWFNENIVLDSLTFDDAICQASYRGLSISRSGNVTVSNSTFKNIKGERAIGIYTWDSEDTARVQNCRFLNNKVDYDNPDHLTGGAMNIGGANGVGVVIINNSLFDNNDSDALFGTAGQFFISNCTFVNNSNDIHFTNAILAAGSTMELYNCISVNNGYFPIWVGELDYISAQLNINNSLIEGGTSSITVAPNGYLYYDSTNIDTDPMFLGMWGDPYMIADNSPCIDAGSLAKLPSFIQMPEYDLAGNPRVYGDSIDIGAYEWNPTIVGFNKIGPKQNKATMLKAYPNPFDWGTYIELKYDADNFNYSEDVNIVIYDNYGILVRNILSGKINKNKQILWYGDDNNGNNLPAGIYNLVLIKGDKELQSLKIVKR